LEAFFPAEQISDDLHPSWKARIYSENLNPAHI